MNKIDEKLRDKKNSLILETNNNSNVLLIVFAGIGGGLGLPMFEFYSSVKVFDVNKLFLRDLELLWYQKGIKGIGNSVINVAKFLKNEIIKNNIQHTVVIGNSAGGYAALLFGHLIEAQVVHSFSPQTFINRMNRFIYMDFRWQSLIRQIYKCNHLNKEYFDLKKFFHNKKNTSTIFNLHFCENHRLDRIHAMRMSKIRNVNLIPYNFRAKHNIVKTLRDSGDLATLLNQNFTT